MNKKIALGFVAVVLVVVASYLFFSEKNINANVIKNTDSEISNIPEEDWLIENCECLEKNRFVCGFEGFEYADGVCRKDGLFTNPLKKCSIYNCSGEIYNLK